MNVEGKERRQRPGLPALPQACTQPCVGRESQSSLQTYVPQTRRKEPAARGSWEEEEETECQQTRQIES